MLEVDGTPEQLPVAAPVPFASYDGTDILMGIADFGCDFVQRGFRHAGSGTRLLALWDQNPAPAPPAFYPYMPNPPNSPAGFNYGRAFYSGRIDAALQAPDPYVALGYDPHASYYQPKPAQGAHGTQVLDIAAGNGRATGAPGVAPETNLIFVQIAGRGPEANVPVTAGEHHIFDALAYFFTSAITAAFGNRAAVMNISLGHNKGPHSGRRPLELAMDALLSTRRRAIVIAAGNGRGGRWHASGTVKPSRTRTITWEFVDPEQWKYGRRDGYPAILHSVQIWYNSIASLRVLLITPQGVRLGPIEPGFQHRILRDGVVVGFVSGSLFSIVANARFIQVDLLAVNSRPEAWQIELIHLGLDPGGQPDLNEIDFHAWIHSDDPSQSSFSECDNDPSCTLSGMATGQAPIIVGAYDNLSVTRRPASFTSVTSCVRVERLHRGLIQSRCSFDPVFRSSFVIHKSVAFVQIAKM